MAPPDGCHRHHQQVAEATGLRHINIGDLVKSQELHSGWDDEFDCWVIDEDKVCEEDEA